MSTPVEDTENNPLLKEFHFPPYDSIKASHVRPGIRALLRQLECELEELERIVEPTWSKLVEPLVRIEDRLYDVSTAVFHLNYVKHHIELRDALNEVLPEILAFKLRLKQSKPIYNAFKAIKESPDWDTLIDAPKRIIESKIKDTVLKGINLEDDKREQFNKIEQELAKLSQKFYDNASIMTKKYEKLIKDKKEIEGLGAMTLQLAAQKALSKGHKHATAQNGPWMIKLDDRIFVDVMQNAKNRILREEVYRASVSHPSSGELDNTTIIDRVLKLRLEKAKLLGYNNFTEESMATKMATVEKAEELLEKLCSASWNPAAQELKHFSKNHGFSEADNLNHWDIEFWSERLLESKYGINQEMLRPYFSFHKVMEGLFSLVNKLFGINIVPANGLAPVWNRNVQFYCVTDSSFQPIAFFYFDPYSRASEKRRGAWVVKAFSRSRVLLLPGSSARLPGAHMVCNLRPPVGGIPCIMTFEEVKIVFHEFGHVLQCTLTKEDESLVSVEQDAVELPSQFMENWCYHRDTFMSIGKHYITGESIPEEIYKKLLAARTFRAGSRTLDHIKKVMVDLELHTRYVPGSSESIHDVYRKVCKRMHVLPPLPEDKFLCYFKSIFSGGYAAGCYIYKITKYIAKDGSPLMVVLLCRVEPDFTRQKKGSEFGWAEVMSADAFSSFEEAGLDDDEALKEMGSRFRETILAHGGGKAAIEVFVEFRGREPSLEALLLRYGLLHVAAST